MGSVTRERIVLVHQHVTDALVRTSEGSALHPADQDLVLEQACTETCDLLTDWLASGEWGQLRQRSLRRVEDAFHDAAGFLGRPLAELLAQVNTEIDVVAAEQLISKAHDAVRAAARKFPRWRQAELFAEAESRLGELRREVCRLATELRTSPVTPAARGRTRKLLLRAAAVIPTLALAMAATSPAQMQQNLSAWEHDAARVVATYLMAQQAHPDLVVAPSQFQAPEIQGPAPNL